VRGTDYFWEVVLFTHGKGYRKVEQMVIGFIGLGIMGAPMAKNCIARGKYPLVVFNGNRHAGELTALGAQGRDTIKEVAAESDVIITMLPDSPEVEQVILGENGVCVGLSKGKIVVDMSSISPVTTRKVAERVAEKGGVMLDAPVSGGDIGAQKGTLAIMVGGPSDAFETIKPILDVMGSSITHVGGIGCGNIVKLANQIIVAGNLAAMGEAMAFARKAGMKPRSVYEAIKGGMAGSKAMELRVENIISGQFPPGFNIGLHRKDLYNALALAREIDGHLPLTAQVQEMFGVLVDKGYINEDHSAVYRFYSEILGND
jgi:2-hydroxy-3-oxopropionate reductase